MKKIVLLLSIPFLFALNAKAQEADKIYNKVDVQAAFVGGSNAWNRFLRKNLNPAVIKNGTAPKGIYHVILRFVVGKDSLVTDIVAETRHGYGFEEEAKRVMALSPKWKPALVGTTPVNAYRRQPITFLVN
ncbi:MAG TPA: hypothetical protein PK504_08685 [Ferruginibacter sp.]|nr:hypothetical protein [Ferruginibacter sp.]HRE62517.1 hypothetical protein [Ferruginibacter sp.]